MILAYNRSLIDLKMILWQIVQITESLTIPIRGQISNRFRSAASYTSVLSIIPPITQLTTEFRLCSDNYYDRRVFHPVVAAGKCLMKLF